MPSTPSRRNKQKELPAIVPTMVADASTESPPVCKMLIVFSTVSSGVRSVSTGIDDIEAKKIAVLREIGLVPVYRPPTVGVVAPPAPAPMMPPPPKPTARQLPARQPPAPQLSAPRPPPST